MDSPSVDKITGVAHKRMIYDRFDDQITGKYGVVVKNWPIKDFCNPSSVVTRIELQTLYNGWESGVTRFEKLTAEEMKAWENERFASRLAIMSAAPPEPTLEHSSPPYTSLSASSTLTTPANFDLSRPPTTTHRTTHDPIIGLTLSPASATNLSPQQTPNPDLIANMILSDPSLQNIDPILLAAGASQECQRVATTIVSAPALPTNPPPPTSQLKRNRDAFQVVTPQSYGTPAKRQRKERGGKRCKRTPAAHQGSENIAPGNATPS